MKYINYFIKHLSYWEDDFVTELKMIFELLIKS